MDDEDRGRVLRALGDLDEVQVRAGPRDEPVEERTTLLLDGGQRSLIVRHSMLMHRLKKAIQRSIPLGAARCRAGRRAAQAGEHGLDVLPLHARERQ